ncbi:MAG: hypothetical protein GY765_01070, partial [bacterium]|nr:hypothetical protein [bacterium]
MIETIIWICVALIALYLAVGLGIYAYGTRKPGDQNKSLVRYTGERLIFKAEPVKVGLKATLAECPVEKEKKEPWNIVLVIDKSTSMRWDGALKNAREA